MPITTAAILRAGSRGQLKFVFDYRNNVQFNWGTGYDWGAWAVYGNEQGESIDFNFIGNYSIAGSDTSIEATREHGFSPRFETSTEGFRNSALASHAKTSRIFQQGNRIDSNVNQELDGKDTGWKMVYGTYTKLDAPVAVPAEFAVKTDSAEEAYRTVLAKAGASPRDQVDARVIKGVRDQNGRIVFSQSEVGGWPALASGTAPRDSDQDGIPDEWEKAHGLNPNDATDSGKITESGYSNLEIFLASLAP
jgi:hypothetical protein